MAATSRAIHYLNGVRADLGTELLSGADGAAIPLRAKTFATLRFFLENPGRLVTKAELFAAVWGNAAVTDDSLVQCIHEIRRAVGDDDHSVLQTVARRGYRLILAGKDELPQRGGASLAVMQFARLGPGLEQESFVEGLVADLITGLARIPGVMVSAGPSADAGETKDLPRIAERLGVRYLVVGSVRRLGDHVRVSGQLLDVASRGYIWTGRFDGAAADTLQLQDRLSAQIIGALEPAVRAAEIARARDKPSGSLDAHDLYLLALPHAHANSPTETDEALRLLRLALQIDPDHVAAHGYAAWCHEQRYLRNGFDPHDRQASLDHADIALGINSRDPQAISMAAFVRANLTRDYDGAIVAMDRALALNGNSALAYGFSALVSAHSERHARAVEHALKALDLSPADDPLNYHPYCALAVANLFSGDFDAAVDYARLTIDANPGFSVAHAYLVAAYIGAGNFSGARLAAARLLQVAPGFSVEGFGRMNLFRRQEELAAALSKAGLPSRAAEPQET